MFLFVVLLFSGTVVGQSTANYVFTTADDGSLSDMTGATSILAAGVDDTPSAVTNIGFTFVLMGQPYTQFSVNDNGNMRLGSTAIQGGSPYIMPNAAVPLLNPFGNDMRVGTDGNVTYKLFGSEPNRYLVVAWNNIMIRYATAAAGTASWEVRLHESGKIEYVYGRMTTNAASPAAYTVGFSVNTTSNNVLSVNTTTHTASVVTPVTTNTYTASSTITTLHSTADGSRRVYTFTPPAAPLAPTDLSYTGIAPAGMTLNWIDNATNEVGYAIYRSTDDVTYTQIATVAADVVSYATTGLIPSTTYFWRVIAFNEGANSIALTGSQATAAAGEITSIATGNWSETTTWSTGVVPTATDNVTITAGDVVTLDAAGTFNNLTVNGTLSLAAFTATGGEVTVSTTGIVNIASGTIGTLSVTRNVTNNGVMDFWASGTQYGKILFTGTGAQTFTCGATSTTNIGNVEVAKTAYANVAEMLTGGTFTIRSGATTGFLLLTSGTFKLSGDAAVSNNVVFLTTGYSIGSTAGFWLNNPNFTVVGQTGSPTNSGLFRLSAGTFNVGTAAGNSMSGGTGAVFTIEGGTLNLASRLQTTSAITFNLSGGVINANMVGNTAGTAAIGLTSTSNTINISGGTINLVQRSTNATPLDYNITGATVNITGGTLNIGTAATITNFEFRVRGYTPSIVVDNTTNNKSIRLSEATYVLGNLTLNAGTQLDAQTFSISIYGNPSAPGNFVNNGTVINTSATGTNRLNFYGENGQQTLSGTGTIGSSTTPFAGLGFGNPDGIVLQDVVIVTNRVNLWNGVVTGSNLITLGNGGTSTPTVQRGGDVLEVGSFAQAPVINPGTSYSVLYSTGANPYTTGFELPATIAFGAVTLTTNVNVTLGGSTSIEKFVMGATNTGNLITSAANLLTVTGSAVTDVNLIAGNTGYVQGPLARTLPASLVGTLTYAFPIGKGTSNLLELVNPTTTADGPVVVMSEVFDAATGGTVGAGIQDGSLGNRYWNAEITSGVANFTNATIRVTQATPALVVENALAQSATQTGSYVLASTNPPAGNTLLSNTITELGYFAIGVKELPQSYVSSTTTQTITTPVMQGDVNQLIIGVQVVTSGNFSPLTVSNIDFSTNGTTNVADITNAKLYYTGTTATFATTTQVGATIATPGATFSINPAQVLADGTNYFWLVYDIAEDAINMNIVDGECTSLTVGGTPYTPTETAPAGSRTIRARLAGTYLVGTGGDYATITAAVAELNSLGVKAPVVFELTNSEYTVALGETFPLTINMSVGMSETNTVTIKPNVGVTTTIAGSTATSVIALNGCDYVIIDGSNDGSDSKDLSVANTYTGGTFNMTIAMFNNGSKGATNCTIKNTINIGTPTVTNSYGIFLNAAGGNFHNITVTNNTIKNAKIGMQFVGVAGNTSNNGIITNNVIGDATMPVKTIGITIGNVNNTLIAGNDIFGEITGNGNNSQKGISIGAFSTTTKVLNNTIHDFYYTGTTGYGCFGIYYNAEATSETIIANNIIYNIKGDGDKVSGGTGNFNYIPSGISVKAGGNIKIFYNTINLTGNVLGSSYTGNSSCIMIDAAVTNLDIRNNILKNSMTAITPDPLNKTFAIVSYAPNTVFTNIDNNNYFVNGTNPRIGYLAADVVDFSAWQTATGKDVNSLNIQPYFTSVTDFSLVANMNCALDGFAAPLAEVTVDFLGVDRDVTNPDMGAIEFTTAPLSAPVANNEEICSGEVVPSLVATTVGDANWYSDEELNTLVFTGNTFETGETEVGEHIYYVTDSYGTCVSDAAMVTLSIYQTPDQPELPVGPITAISNEVSDYSVAEVVGATSYEWFLTPAEAGVLTPNGASASIAWNIDFAGTASVSVQAHNANCSSTVSDVLEVEVSLVVFYYTVTFNVVDEASALILDAIITFDGVEYAAGEYVFDNLEAGAYEYTVAKDGYVSETGTATVIDADLIIDITLVEVVIPTYSVTFNVVDEVSSPIVDAIVTFDGVEYAAGEYVFTNLIAGAYDYTIAKEGYVSETGTATVIDGDLVVDITLVEVVIPTYSVTFNVVDEASTPIVDAIVTFDGVEATAGEYVFTNLIAGAYDYSVAKDDFIAVIGTATVVDVDQIIDITLFPVGVNSNILTNLSAYPNPFSNQITISNPSVVSRVVVANLIGQVVMDVRTNGVATVETAKLSAGIYLVTFEAANGESVVRKMVKK